MKKTNKSIKAIRSIAAMRSIAIIAMVLALGLVLSGCATATDATVSGASGGVPASASGAADSGASEGVPRTVTITGVPAGYSTYVRLVFDDGSWYGREVALSTGANLDPREPKDITVTFILGEDPWVSDPVAWTESGEYWILLDHWKTKDQNLTEYDAENYECTTYFIDGGPIIFNDETPHKTFAWDQFVVYTH